MFDILWEMHQQGRLNDAVDRSEDASATARNLQADVRRLERMVEGLNLANMAMWSMLKEKFNVTDEQLLRRIHEIDASDGKLDGRHRPVKSAPSACVHCSRPVSKGRPTCIYCGKSVLGL